jgi:hypothetical protein
LKKKIGNRSKTLIAKSKDDEERTSLKEIGVGVGEQ